MGRNYGMLFKIFEKSLEGKEGYDSIRCDMMRWQRDWIDLRRSRAYGSRETKWNYRCDCHWRISVRRSHRQRVDQRFFPSRSASPTPTRIPSHFFFTKDNPRWPPFCLLSEIAWPLLGNWPKIAADRRLLCGYGLNFAPPQKYHWLLFPHLLLLCLLLPDVPPSYSVSSNLGTSPRAFYSSPVRDFSTLENHVYTLFILQPSYVINILVYITLTSRFILQFVFIYYCKFSKMFSLYFNYICNFYCTYVF